MNAREQWQLTMEAAELYERYPARYILGPWAPLLAEAARLEAGERVLDVACGTGVVTRVAAERVGATGRVVGVDLNPGMIAVARSLPAPVGASIEWLERSALDLRLEDASFDVVLCQQGLQFFPDKAIALQEMCRVLDHGGRLALSVWHGTGLYHSAVVEALARFVGNETAISFSASRQAPIAEELRRLATEAGFSVIDVGISRINVHLPRLDKFTLDHLAATPVASVIAATDPEARKKIGARVLKQLQHYAYGDPSFRSLDPWPPAATLPHPTSPSPRQMPLPQRGPQRFQNQSILRYTLSASGLSSNRIKVAAVQQLSLIRSPDAPV